MRVAAVIGFPVRHSMSPAIHNAAFTALGLDWRFLQLAFAPEDGGAAVRALRLLDAGGASVTMPHKRTVIEQLDALAHDARATGAVNTIVRDGARFVGHNTDGPGFVRFLRVDAGVDPAGRTVLILGAGGAARGVAVALARAGARVAIAARRREQAEEVAALTPGIEPRDWDEPGRADVVVNATPARDGLPLGRFPLVPGVVAVDMIYPPPPTSFLEAARAAGAIAFGGLGMLVHQAAMAFELWTGADAPLRIMREAAEAALARAAGGGAAR